MDVKDMVDYEKLTVAELEFLCQERGISVYGHKKSSYIDAIIYSEKKEFEEEEKRNAKIRESIEEGRKKRLFFKENKSIISILMVIISTLSFCLISLYMITWLWIAIFSPPNSILTWAIFIILQSFFLFVNGGIGYEMAINQFYSGKQYKAKQLEKKRKMKKIMAKLDD